MTTLMKRHQNQNENWLPSIFNDFFDYDWMNRTKATAPAINVKESKNEYTVEVAAPGMTKNDFHVSIDADNNLVISMEKKVDNNNGNNNNNNENKEKETRYLRREFSYSRFQQTMILPDDVDKTKINAKVENGVLNIMLPKVAQTEEKNAQRLIEVK